MNHPPTPTTPNHQHHHSNISTPLSSISTNSSSNLSSALDQQYEQQSKRFFHHFISTTGQSASNNSSSSSINSTPSTPLSLNNNIIENSSDYGNIYLYFHYMSQLDFSQANYLIKNSTNQSSQIVNRNSKYKQIEDEIIGSLRRFIQCETLYYDANYSPNEKQDLHSLYSLLSSNLSLISMNAPYEFTNSNNNNMDNSIYNNNHDHQSSDHLLMMMMMMDQNNNSPSMTTNPSANIDYIYYKQVLQPTTGIQKYNLNLIDKEFILSKQLIKDFRVLIQLRLEIIAFYRILSRYKHPPKYDNYVRIINSLKSKYINRINHTFFEKIVQNINMELNTLTSLFECEYNICNYKYKESVFTLWRTKSLFKQWNQLFVSKTPSSTTVNPQNYTSSSNISVPIASNNAASNSTLSRSLSEDNLLVHHQIDQQQQQQHLQVNNEKHSSSTGSISSNNSSSQNLLSNGGNNTTNTNNMNTQAVNNLSKTNLYKWMTMIFGFSQSKFTFIFHDIVTNQSSQMTCNQSVTGANMSPTLAVDYIQWIKSFNEIIKPETVCLIYNASHDNLDTSPILETDPEKGYLLRLRNLENADDMSLSGIKLYPCIFHYPQTQEENKISKQTLMYTYWPNILSLIMENSSDLEVSEEAFYFSDPKTLTTYYLCQVTPKLYLSTIIVKSNSKDHQIALKFMSQMNSFLRNRKVFNYLTTIIPRSEQSSPSSVLKSKDGSNPKESNSNHNTNKKSTFSLFKKK